MKKNMLRLGNRQRVIKTSEKNFFDKIFDFMSFLWYLNEIMSKKGKVDFGHVLLL